MSLLDVIVLTNTKNFQYQNLTTECINSYLSSGEKFINRILLMETNKDWDSSYWNSLSPKVNCVVPAIPFNYNRFLNKALELCTSSIICISNNDVFPQKECVPNIIKAFEENPNLMSASPIDRTWHRNSYTDFPSDDIRTLNSAAQLDKAGTTGANNQIGLLSYLGRINYAYDDKYLFSVSYRTDGSSYFAQGKKWGSFPSNFGWLGVKQGKIIKRH